jgi:hypothetical protein
MLKNVLRGIRTNRFNLLNFKQFSRRNELSIEIYPDQIIENVKATVNDKNESNFADIEAQILDNLNYFDADQYVDIVSILAYANKGTDNLWTILSNKIYDYELDIAQTYMLDEALLRCNKNEEFMEDPIARNTLVWEVKWPKGSKVFKKLL